MEAINNVPPVRARWLSHLPYVALALFLGAIAALVWLTRQRDADEQNATLISDVLWMEQNLRFQLDRNEASLQQLGPELLGGGALSPSTEAQLRHLLSAERGLVRVTWLSPDQRVIGAMPPHADDAGSYAKPAASGGALTFDLARGGELPVYGPAYRATDGETRFEVHVPVWTDRGLRGIVVGVYSLSNLVVRELPWWFSERYRVAVLDADGREIAARSKIAPLAAQRSYTTPLDPPGHGLTLRVTAYRSEMRWVTLLLGGAIVLFGAVIVWSVWQLRRQLARR